MGSPGLWWDHARLVQAFEGLCVNRNPQKVVVAKSREFPQVGISVDSEASFAQQLIAPNMNAPSPNADLLQEFNSSTALMQ